MLTLMFVLLAVHAILDFPLQGEAVAREKSRHSLTDLQSYVPWYYWMGAHSLSHGLGVAYVLGNVDAGICETLAHFVIDYYKCEGKYSIHVDQALHVLCKVAWVWMFWM